MNKEEIKDKGLFEVREKEIDWGFWIGILILTILIVIDIILSRK